MDNRTIEIFTTRTNQLLDNICLFINKKSDFQLIISALQAIENSANFDTTNEELNKRIVHFNSYFREDPEDLGIYPDQQSEFQNIVKTRVIARVNELREALSSPKEIELFLNRNKVCINQVRDNQARLRNAKPPQDQILNSYEFLQELLKTGFCLRDPLFLLPTSVEDSFLFSNRYMTLEDLKDLTVGEFLFLEDPKKRNLVIACLNSLERFPLTATELVTLIREMSRFIQKEKICELIVQGCLTYTTITLLNEAQICKIEKLSELFLNKIIYLNFIAEESQLINFLIKYPSIYNLINSRKISLDFLKSCTLAERRNLKKCQFVLEWMRIEEKEIKQFITAYPSFTWRQHQQYWCNYLSHLYPSIKSEHFYYLIDKINLEKIGLLLSQDRLTDQDLEEMNPLTLKRISKEEIYDLVLKGKIPIRVLKDMSSSEYKNIRNKIICRLISDDILSHTDLSILSLDFIDKINDNNYEFIKFCLKFCQISLQGLFQIDPITLCELCNSNTIDLIKYGLNLDYLMSLSKDNLFKITQLASLIINGHLTVEEAKNLNDREVDRLAKKPIIRLIINFLISVQEVLFLSKKNYDKVNFEEVVELIIRKMIDLSVILNSGLQEVELIAIANSQGLAQKGFVSLDDLWRIEERVYNYLGISTITTLIEEKFLTVRDWENTSTNDIKNLSYLKELSIQKLILKRFLTITEFNNLTLNEKDTLSCYKVSYLIRKGIISVQKAFVLTHQNKVRLFHAGIINLIEHKALTVEQVEILEEDTYKILQDKNIVRLIIKKHLSLQEVNRSKIRIARLLNYNICQLILNGFATAKFILSISDSDYDCLKSRKIEFLISYDIIDVETALNLNENEKLNLSIVNIEKLIKDGFITFNKAVSLSQEEFKKLNNKKISELILLRIISVEDVLGLSIKQVEILCDEKISNLFQDNFLTFQAFQQLDLEVFEVLRNTTIETLIKAKKLSIESAIKLKPLQIRQLSIPLVQQKILEGSISIGCALMSLQQSKRENRQKRKK